MFQRTKPHFAPILDAQALREISTVLQHCWSFDIRKPLLRFLAILAGTQHKGAFKAGRLRRRRHWWG